LLGFGFSRCWHCRNPGSGSRRHFNELPRIARRFVVSYSKALGRIVVVGAMVEPVDISNAIVWLVSDDARYVTGVTLPVDAGFTNKK
jgi:NAD(P)-dependent dehydrogenase (short-subunit alcohol dehydrogenase family)